MRSTISVVIVAGACGIAAGTPLAILGAIGRAAQDGAIIKGGLYLEKLAEVDTILLDKTGTLTYGTPQVIEIQPANGVSPSSLLEAAAIAESQSEHPVARAILTKATELGIHVQQPDRFDYTPGRGIVAGIRGEEIVVGNWIHFLDEGIKTTMPATSDGAVLVMRGGHLLGSIRVADLVRPEAKAAIQNLKSIGLKTILLTGDNGPYRRKIGHRRASMPTACVIAARKTNITARAMRGKRCRHSPIFQQPLPHCGGSCCPGRARLPAQMITSQAEKGRRIETQPPGM